MYTTTENYNKELNNLNENPQFMQQYNFQILFDEFWCKTHTQ